MGGQRDLPAYNPDSYERPGVAKGKLSEKFTITSKIYEGMKANWWVWASPGVDPAKPSALMVWQDGQGLATGQGGQVRLFTVVENLIEQKLLPPMVHVLIEPGRDASGRAMRAIEYDTVSDRYGRFLMEEVLPEAEKLYKLRQDGYSRAIGGTSSGAICSFNVAWHFPEKFARVHSTIGSYTSIQWRPEQKQEGGNVYPFKVRKEPKRNIRVWLSDGAGDLENDHGSWPLQNIQMANSLKRMGYDFHFRFDESAHNGARFAVDLPESLSVALAGIRSGQDQRDVRAGGGGEGEAAVQGADRESGGVVATQRAAWLRARRVRSGSLSGSLRAIRGSKPGSFRDPSTSSHWGFGFVRGVAGAGGV